MVYSPKALPTTKKQARERSDRSDMRPNKLDLNYPDWNPSGITASASPAEQLGTAAIKLCIRSYGTVKNSMFGSNPCCFRAVQSPVVIFVQPVITGYTIEL